MSILSFVVVSMLTSWVYADVDLAKSIEIEKALVESQVLNKKLILFQVPDIELYSGKYPPDSKVSGLIKIEALSIVRSFQLATPQKGPNFFKLQSGNLVDDFWTNTPFPNKPLPIENLFTNYLSKYLHTFGKADENCFGAVLYATRTIPAPTFVSEPNFKKIILSSTRQLDLRSESLDSEDILVIVEAGSNEWLHAMYYLFNSAVFTKANADSHSPFVVETMEQTIFRMSKEEPSLGRPPFGPTWHLIAFRKKL